MNPFEQQMVRMQIPEGMGKMLSLAGFILEADKDGCVTVPRAHVPEMISHGLSVAAEQSPSKAKN